MRITEGELREAIKSVISEMYDSESFSDRDEVSGEKLSDHRMNELMAENFEDEMYWTREKLVRCICQAEKSGFKGIVDWVLSNC